MYYYIYIIIVIWKSKAKKLTFKALMRNEKFMKVLWSGNGKDRYFGKFKLKLRIIVNRNVKERM